MLSQSRSQKQDGAEAQGGPVGEGSYVVQEGDCLESIAFERGLLWETIWNAPENWRLKNARNHNILLPGDRLFEPEIRPKSVDCGTDKRHRFVRKGAPSRVHVRVVEWVWSDPGEAGPSPGGGDAPAAQSRPRTHVPYVLEIDGCLISGQTDGDGWIDQPISPGARGGSLTLDPGSAGEQKLPIVLGGLDPSDADTGIRQRLANLGFDPGSDAPDSEQFQGAVSAFQAAIGLAATGTMDDGTREALQASHGS